MTREELERKVTELEVKIVALELSRQQFQIVHIPVPVSYPIYQHQPYYSQITYHYPLQYLGGSYQGGSYQMGSSSGGLR